MSLRNDKDEIEFYEFTRDLLAAQRRDFVSTTQFNRDTLRRILHRICNILADKAAYESATIHLKLYDPAIINDDECQFLKQRLQRKSDLYRDANQPDPKEPFRSDPLQTALAFPFSVLPRGGLQLIACNRESPWNQLMPESITSAATKQPYSIVELAIGLSAEIVQDNWARKRDRSKILASRSDRKLGIADALIWDNQGLNHMFRNYYGVPIKLHADGEVIGILKLENKRRSLEGRVHAPCERTEALENCDEGKVPTIKTLKSQIREIATSAEAAAPGESHDNEIDDLPLIDFLIGLIDSTHTPGIDVDSPESYIQHLISDTTYPISPLALAYLGDDLDSCRCINGNIEDNDAPLSTLFPPYPHVDRLLKKGVGHAENSSLLPPDGEAPPLQFWAESVDAEAWLCKQIWEGVESRDSARCLHDGLIEWRRLLRGALQKSKNAVSFDYKGKVYEFKVEEARRGAVGGGIDQRLPAFTFRLTAAGNSKAAFIAMMPPAIRCIVDPTTDVPYDERLIGDVREGLAVMDVFGAVNPEWNEGVLSRVKSFTYRGERVAGVVLENGEVVDLPQEIPDLLVDRLAARVQALIYSLPAPGPVDADARMLTWAAREIGHLVQKEIVFRGNRHQDSMPLTAMEFDRLPISDLSFVDDLRVRVEQATGIRSNIDHHLDNVVTEKGMASTVQHSSRVKEFRSHLERLGERHDGYVRGALSVWFFVLGAMIRKADGDLEANGFSSCAFEFYRRVCEHAAAAPGDRDSPLSRERLESVPEMLSSWSRVPDPPLADLGFFSWPWRDRLDLPADRTPLWQIVEGNLLACDGRQWPAGSIGAGSRKLDSGIATDWVLRNHEPFFALASSLMVQLSGSEVPGYQSFYETMFALRRLLSSSTQEIEDQPRLRPLREIFAQGKGDGKDTSTGTLWSTMLDYAVSHSTEEFLGDYGDAFLDFEDSHRAHLSPAGAFKRVRTLNYRLREQRSTAHLEWELGRFDLLGCQLNCLYKNQVAALYEEIWDRGDPFSGGEDNVQWKRGSRTRWVCLRTNFHRGDYNALQIAALSDPSAIRRGFWDMDDENAPPRDQTGEGIPGDGDRDHLMAGAVYNLSRLRMYWSHCLRGLSNGDGSFFYRYNELAANRKRWVQAYVNWWKSSEKNWKKEEKEDLGTFGLYFGSAIVDLILFALRKLWETDVGQKDPEVSKLKFAILKLGDELAELLNHAAPVSEVNVSVRLGEAFRVFYSTNDNSFPKLFNAWYQKSNVVDAESRSWVDETVNSLIASEDGRLKDEIDKGLAREIQFFARSLSHDERISITHTLRCGDSESQLRVWERFRRSQKDYLFWLGQGITPEVSHLRCREDVLGRIENYTLLWSLDWLKGIEGRPKHFDFWNARDLFYYVRSLVPMEVQVRTHLASVLAEQYHDRVYKQHPHASSWLARTRMQDVAKSVDDLDKELEVDYEDYGDREARSGA